MGHSPPIESATFQPGNGVERARVQRHDLVGLELGVGLRGMLELAGDWRKQLVQPSCNFPRVSGDAAARRAGRQVRNFLIQKVQGDRLWVVHVWILEPKRQRFKK